MRILAIAASLALLIGCGSTPTPGMGPSSTTAPAPSPTPSPVPFPFPAPTPTPGPTPQPFPTPAPAPAPTPGPSPTPAPPPTQNIVFKIDGQIISNLGLETLAFTASSSIPLTDYVWDFGDGSATVSGGPKQSHTYVTQGRRTVRLTAQSDTRGQLVTALDVDVAFKIP